MRVGTMAVGWGLASCALLGGAPPARAQHCALVCPPTVTLMPGVIRTHLRGGPHVRDLATGAVQQLPASANAEIIVSVAAATGLPRVSLYGSAQWLPNAAASRNPFTLYTASELGERVRANAPTLAAGVSVALLPATATSGWLDLGANVADLYSQAARPDDASAYTHKLDLDLVAHAHVFAWLPKATYAHRVSLYGILDYVASGLPRAGDEVPTGRVFLDDARPLALIAGLALPLTPSVP